MTYQGTVRNGVVVLEDDVTLPEGAVVRVEPVNSDQAKQQDTRSLSEALLELAGSAGAGLPSDLARNHDHYLYGVPKK